MKKDKAPKSRRVSIDEARQLSYTVGALIHWRPGLVVDDHSDYDVVYEQGL